MSLYRKILSQGWKTTWRYKYLWFFGLFAAFLGGGGEYEVVNSFTGRAGVIFPGIKKFAETGIFSGQGITNVCRVAKNDPVSFIKVILIFLVILILFGILVWLAVVSQAASVNNAAGYLSGKKIVPGKSNNDFKSGIDKGNKKFWPILGFNAILKLMIGISFLVISLPVVLTAGKPNTLPVMLLYVFAFIIFIILALSVSFIFKYSIAFLVVKGKSFREALNSGWQLFIKNWLVSLEMAFILFLINFLAGFLVILIVSSFIIPFLFLAFAFFKIASTVGFWFVVSMALIIMFAFIVLVGAVLSTFQISSWTGLFLELINKGGVSKIIRMAEGLKNKIS